jgi:hypothetical protein
MSRLLNAKGIGAGLICVLAAAFTVVGCNHTDRNHEALKAAVVTCPPSAKLEYQPWGEDGLIAICKLDHGPFVAARGGKVVMRGQNDSGKPTGEWLWYDEKGQVEKKQQH